MTTLRVRLLKLAARRPLLTAAIACAVPVAVAATTIASARHAAPAVDIATPRAVLGRIWFDSYPKKTTDNVQFWLWLGGGIGLHETGSYWRSSLDIFEFERSGDKIAMRYLQDGKTEELKFKVTTCDEKPPFDLCLDLDSALGGNKRYYGFGDLDDMNAKLPWARALFKSAEERASAARPSGEQAPTSTH